MAAAAAGTGAGPGSSEHLPRGPSGPPAAPRGGRRPRGKRAPRPEVAPPRAPSAPALPGQGAPAARGRFEARAGEAGGPLGAVATARGARRWRPRSGRVPAGPRGGAMDQAAGDLKQALACVAEAGDLKRALPCVAEAPAVHVEVHQRTGR